MTPQEAKAQYGATHYSTMRDGVTPQMYYKQQQIPINDGSVRTCWVYLTFANLWHGSYIQLGSKEENKLVRINE